ncbi:MAG: hypothetical protein WD768_17140 [Phycisphaeraceae bacterium]
MSADLGAWYARSTPVMIAFVLIVAGLGFYTSTLSGRMTRAAPQSA